MAWSYCTNPGCRQLVAGGGRCTPCASRQNASRLFTETHRHVAARGGVQDMYHSPRWQALRKQVLSEAKYLCECEDCARLPCPRLANTVDHRIPHDGDEQLKWDRGNLKAMAHECHTRKSVAERGQRAGKATTK